MGEAEAGTQWRCCAEESRRQRLHTLPRLSQAIISSGPKPISKAARGQAGAMLRFSGDFSSRAARQASPPASAAGGRQDASAATIGVGS